MASQRARAVMELLFAASIGAVAASCGKHPDAAPELHCFRADSSRYVGSGGLNPLLMGRFFCFDDASACQSRAKDFQAGCALSGSPRWHCFTIESTNASTGPSTTPLANTSSCFPSMGMCDASRFPATDDSPHPAVNGPCKAVDTVYCQADSASCFATESACNDAGELASAVIKGSDPHRPCVARRSAP